MAAFKTSFLNAPITEKMKRVREILERFGFLNDTFPYQPELSRHAVVVALLSCVFFLFFDIMHTLKDDNSIVWWSVHVGLLGFFYFFLQPSMSSIRFFSQPLIGEPSYSNLSKWYVSWLFVALLYHLPSSHSVAISMRMNLSLFLTIFIFSIVCLLVFRYIFILVEYIFSCQNRKWPDIWTILQFSAVVSIACCVFLSHCRERPLEQRNLKDKVCSSWLAPVESEGYYYPLLCMRDENCGTIYVLYAKLASTSSESSPASSSDEINLIYSCWITFMGLYIANYVAERSLEPGEKYKKNKQTKPDFLDMVPWYSGTSADLYKTVFDLMVSVTVFLGRFDMRILQAAMNQIQVVPKNKKEAQAGIQQGDYLYDHRSKEKELWFDFIADTGDGGNSVYTVARLLAQPHIKTNSGILKRGDLLLIGGDLAYPNPSEFTYERRLFRPFKYALQPPPCHEQGRMGVKKLDEMPPCYEQQRMAVDKSAIPPGMTGLKQDKKRTKKRKQSLPYNGPRCFVIPGNHDWFDGLHTFTRNICHRSWLGGWFMPQKKSYFALQLPMGWWIFGLDLALHGDIDVYQFEFFSKLARKMLALRNIWNFRKENWQFDFIGGIIYFMLVFSMFPQCELDHIFKEDSISGFSRSFFGTVWNAFIFMMDLSYVSLGGATLLLILAVAFVPSKVSSKTRVMIGVLHVSAHLAAALILMLVLELGIETFVRHKLVATSGYHSLYRWHQSMFHRHLPVPIAIQDSIKRWTFGLYPACIKYLMSAFDLPELMAVTRSNICKNGMESISRWGAIIYYASIFLYFWVLSTPAVSFVFGSYLYVCINWFNLHYDEAFSSLRIADYKAFTRFHIKHNGDLEVFTLAVDKVPEDWELDPEWEGPNSNQWSHLRENPSQWKAADSDQEPLNTVRIIDKFVIPRKHSPESLVDISGSETE